MQDNKDYDLTRLDLTKFTKDHVANNNDDLLYVKPPNKYGQYPEISNNILDRFHNYDYTVFDTDRIQEYFDDIITEDNISIEVINGVIFGRSYYTCDYCNKNIEEDYYYCYTCNQHMCNLCKSETSLNNNSKNYSNHKDKLDLCHKSHNIVSRKLVQEIYCDICDGVIFDKNSYNRDDYDICMSCSKTDEGIKLILDNQLSLIDTVILYNICDFGSLLDWVPVIRDPDYNMVLYNLNSDSIYYKKIALVAMDNHGRLGYYTVMDDKATLTSILENILDISDKKKLKNNIENEYNYPIHELMDFYNMPCYYG